MTSDDLPRRRLFGLDFVDATSLDPVIDVLVGHVPRPVGPSGPLPLVVTPNVDQLVHLDRGTDAVAAALIERATHVLPDGQPIVWASRLLGRPLGARLAGSTLVAEMFPRLVAAGAPVLVVATSDEVAARIDAEPAPTSTIVAPQLSLGDRAAIDAFAAECAVLIADGRPSHVFVTLGFPKQCNVITGIARRLEADGAPMPLFFAVGASFDMHYGLVRRAPVWMQRVGLEWFFRFVQEPRRLFRRYFVDDPAFVRIVWRERRAQRSRDTA